MEEGEDLGHLAEVVETQANIELKQRRFLNVLFPGYYWKFLLQHKGSLIFVNELYITACYDEIYILNLAQTKIIVCRHVNEGAFS